jgi:hypothetical protein
MKILRHQEIWCTGISSEIPLCQTWDSYGGECYNYGPLARDAVDFGSCILRTAFIELSGGKIQKT